MTARQAALLGQRFLMVALVATFLAATWKATALPGSYVPGLVGRDALIIAVMWLSAAWLIVGPGSSLLRLVGSPPLASAVLVRFSWNSPMDAHLIALGFAVYAISAVLFSAVRTFGGYQLKMTGRMPARLHFSLRSLLLLTALAGVIVSLTRWIPVHVRLNQLSLAELRQLSAIAGILALLGVLSTLAGFKRVWLGGLCTATFGPLAGWFIAHRMGVPSPEHIWWCVAASALAAGTAAVVRNCGAVVVSRKNATLSSQPFAFATPERAVYEV